MILVRIINGRIFFADLPAYLKPQLQMCQRFVDSCDLRSGVSYCLTVSEDENVIQVCIMTPLKEKEL